MGQEPAAARRSTSPIHSGLDSKQFYVVRATYTDTRAGLGGTDRPSTSFRCGPSVWQPSISFQLSGPQVITAASAEGASGSVMSKMERGALPSGEPQGNHRRQRTVSSDKAGNVASFGTTRPPARGSPHHRAQHGGWDTYATVSAPITTPRHHRDLFVVFTAAPAPCST